MNKVNTYLTVFSLSKVATNLALALAVAMVNNTLGYITLALMLTSHVSSYMYSKEMERQQEEEIKRQSAELMQLLTNYGQAETPQEQTDNVTLQ